MSGVNKFKALGHHETPEFYALKKQTKKTIMFIVLVV